MTPPASPSAHQRLPQSSLPEEEEILLIDVGARSFGLPLAQVRYVASMPPGFASNGPGTADHFLFEGVPLSYVSLWARLGLATAYAEYEEMQAMLPQRRQDHIDWMGALEDSLRTGSEFAKARNPRECAFGKWFYSQRAQDRRLALLLAQFEQPHAAIHALADRLLGVARIDKGEALQQLTEAKNSTLAGLLQLFDSAQRLVIELQRRIAIIVTDGASSCALGADGVRDIIAVPPDRLRRDSGRRSAGGSRATAGLIILDDQTVVPLLDWQAFLEEAERQAV